MESEMSGVGTGGVLQRVPLHAHSSSPLLCHSKGLCEERHACRLILESQQARSEVLGYCGGCGVCTH